MEHTKVYYFGILLDFVMYAKAESEVQAKDDGLYHRNSCVLSTSKIPGDNIPSLQEISADILFISNKSDVLAVYSYANAMYLTNLKVKCRNLVRERFAFFLDRYGEEQLSNMIGESDFAMLMTYHTERLAAERRLALKGTVLERPVVPVSPDEISHNGFYPLKVLVQGVAWPAEVDASRREEYLTDEEFQQVFNMAKEEFRALPKYVRIRTKKDKLLF